jgi:hypothetical protein
MNLKETLHANNIASNSVRKISLPLMPPTTNLQSSSITLENSKFRN